MDHIMMQQSTPLPTAHRGDPGNGTEALLGDAAHQRRRHAASDSDSRHSQRGALYQSTAAVIVKPRASEETTRDLLVVAGTYDVLLASSTHVFIMQQAHQLQQSTPVASPNIIGLHFSLVRAQDVRTERLEPQRQ
jgi:hypothetical protein